MYVDRILSCQLPDGGWSLFGGSEDATESDNKSDPDITGMALQALAKYMDQPAVAKAVAEALDCMSRYQGSDAGYGTWNTVNCESAVQILVGLCELGSSPDDPRFVKNGRSVLDNVLSYQTKAGGFQHTADGSGNNQMTAEQGLYGIVAALRLAQYGLKEIAVLSESVSAGTSRNTGSDKQTYFKLTLAGGEGDSVEFWEHGGEMVDSLKQYVERRGTKVMINSFIYNVTQMRGSLSKAELEEYFEGIED